MFAFVKNGAIAPAPDGGPSVRSKLPLSATLLTDSSSWVTDLSAAPVAVQESTGWYVVTTVPAPTVSATQRADFSYGMVSGRPSEVWTIRAETAAELTARNRAGNLATLTNETTWLNKLTELREFLTDADVSTFMNAANNTAFGAADRRALKTALRTIDRLTKAVERGARSRHPSGILLDDITNI